MGAKSKVKRREKGEVRLELPTCFEAELSSFLAWVQLEKGLAKNTVHSYENDLPKFYTIYLYSNMVSDFF